MAIPFLAINFYDSLFVLVYLFIAITLLIYKNQKYPLPGYALSAEAVLILMFAITQLFRYFIAKKAVLDKQPKFVAIYIILSIFVLLSYIF